MRELREDGLVLGLLMETVGLKGIGSWVVVIGVV